MDNFNWKEEKRKEEERLQFEREKIIKKYEDSIVEVENKFDKYVLQVTPIEYVESNKDKLENYEFRTVESEDDGDIEVSYKNQTFPNSDSSKIRAKRDLIEKGEDLEARVIVNLKPTFIGKSTHLMGTAMIPKNK